MNDDNREQGVVTLVMFGVSRRFALQWQDTSTVSSVFLNVALFSSHGWGRQSCPSFLENRRFGLHAFHIPVLVGEKSGCTHSLMIVLHVYDRWKDTCRQHL